MVVIVIRCLAACLLNNSRCNFLVQAGWGGEEYGVAFAYRYGQCGTGQRRGTNFMMDDSFNNECWRDVWKCS